MTDDDGNGQPAPKRYVIVDHDGNSTEIEGAGMRWVLLLDLRDALPVGGRFTVTRVS